MKEFQLIVCMENRQPTLLTETSREVRCHVLLSLNKNVFIQYYHVKTMIEWI